MWLEKEKLAVRRLPEEKVGKPLLPACADNDIGVWHLSAPHILSQRFFSDIYAGNCRSFRRSCNLRACTIRKTHPQRHPRIIFRRSFNFAHSFLDVVCKAFTLAKIARANSFFP